MTASPREDPPGRPYLSPWASRPLGQLLADHDLAGIPEQPFPNNGWSGAQLTLLERDG